MPITQNIENSRIAFLCDLCFRKITNFSIILCDVCDEFRCTRCQQLLLSSKIRSQCFSSKHPFRKLSQLNSPCLRPNLTILDEFVFLDGFVTRGNFADIAELLSKPDVFFSEKDIEKHYFYLSDQLYTSDREDEDQDLQTNSPRSNPHDPSLVSYMPYRKEFEFEVLNDYETVISTLQFYSSDHQIDTKLKEHMLNYYKTVLLVRGMWRNFVLDRDLVNVHDWTVFESSDAGKTIDKYKWLLQFLSTNDYLRFAESLEKEKKLKKKIDELASSMAVSKVASLPDYAHLLSSNEKQLCINLNIEHSMYVKFKKLAIDCFIAKIPLKSKLFSLFNLADEKERVEYLYEWFVSNDIVYFN